MPIFIDESGDTGFEEHSSKFFRISAVLIPKEHAESLREAIGEIRNLFGLKSNYEFKYAKSHHHPEHRIAIFQAAIRAEMRFAFCGIDKTKLDPDIVGPEFLFEACSHSVSFALNTILKPLDSSVAGRERKHRPDDVIVDDCQNPRFLSCIARAFRITPPGVQASTNKPRFKNSRAEPLLQIADLICGICGDVVDGHDPNRFNLIRDHCISFDHQ